MAKSGTVSRSKQPVSKRPLQPLYGDFPPYRVSFALRGVKPLMFNRFFDYPEYDEAPAKQPRQSINYEEMVWRTDDGMLALPSTHVVASIVSAGRLLQDADRAAREARRTRLRQRLLETRRT